MDQNKMTLRGNKMKRSSLFVSSLTTILLLGIAIINCHATEFQGTLNSVAITDAAGANLPPTAVINYSKNGDIYTFDASQSSDQDGTITEYKWDFGDGATASGMSTSHQFPADPTQVTLTVVDNNMGIEITQVEINVYTEPFEIVADDANVAFSQISGTWAESTSSEGYYNVGYKTAPAGTGNMTGTWILSLPTKGTYEIFCYYTAYFNRASNTPYKIMNNGKEVATKLVNQQVNGKMFYSLGTYNLEQGSLSITISNAGNGYAIADAVKATYKL